MPNVFYIDHCLFRLGGHPFNMAVGFAEECRDRGWSFRAYVHHEASLEVVAALAATANFRHRASDRLSKDPLTGLLDNYLGLGAAFAEGCAALTADGCASGDLVVVSLAYQNEIAGIAQWLATLPDHLVPHVAVVIHNDNIPVGEGGTVKAGSAAMYYRHAAQPLLDYGKAGRFTLVTPIEAQANKLRQITMVPVLTLPVPVAFDAILRAAALDPVDKARPPVMSVLGNSTREKGFHLLPAVLGPLLNQRRHVRLDLQLLPLFMAGQVSAEQVFQRALPEAERPDWRHFHARLVTDSRVHCTIGEVAMDDYSRMVARTDLMLIPYSPKAYGIRTSGVFTEACAAGRAVVVPADTWMGRRVLAGEAAGTVFTEWSAGGIRAAIETALDNIVELGHQARRLAPFWHQRYGIGAFMDGMIQWMNGR